MQVVERGISAAVINQLAAEMGKRFTPPPRHRAPSERTTPPQRQVQGNPSQLHEVGSQLGPSSNVYMDIHISQAQSYQFQLSNNNSQIHKRADIINYYYKFESIYIFIVLPIIQE